MGAEVGAKFICLTLRLGPYNAVDVACPPAKPLRSSVDLQALDRTIVANLVNVSTVDCVPWQETTRARSGI